jgi:hypothetical protein
LSLLTDFSFCTDWGWLEPHPGGFLLRYNDDQSQPLLARLSDDLTQDTAFAAGAQLSLGTASNLFAVAPDGTIYADQGSGVAGVQAWTAQGVPKETFYFAGSEAPTALAVDDRGRLLVGSLVDDHRELRRYLQRGGLDLAFGTAGVAEAPGAGPFQEIRVAADGRIYAVASSPWELAAWDASGHLIEGWGLSPGLAGVSESLVPGVIALPQVNGVSTRSTFPLEDGTVVLAAYAREGSDHVKLIRLDHDGSAVTAWGNGGILQMSELPPGYRGAPPRVDAGIDREFGRLFVVGSAPGVEGNTDPAMSIERIWL